MLAFRLGIDFHRGLMAARMSDSLEFTPEHYHDYNVLEKTESVTRKLLASVNKLNPENEWRFLKTFVAQLDNYITALEKHIDVSY